MSRGESDVINTHTNTHTHMHTHTHTHIYIYTIIVDIYIYIIYIYIYYIYYYTIIIYIYTIILLYIYTITPVTIIVDFQRLLQDLIYICFSCVTNQRSSRETMQLNLYLTPISQATYSLKELQFECKHMHMVESSLIQIIYFAMKGLHGGLFNFILFYLVMIYL